MKRIFLSVVAIAAATTAMAQQQPATTAAPATPAPKIAATVNGEVITVDDLNRMYANLPPRMRQSYDENGGREQFLEQYLRKRLVIQEAKKQGFEKDPEVAALLRDQYEAALFDLYVRRSVAADVVSDKDVRTYYDAHAEEFTTPERIKARHIMATPGAQPVFNTSKDNATTDAQAQAKMQNLITGYHLNPSNFAELAMRFSEDVSAPQGGDLGWFERGKMVKEFDEAAFATKVGEMSPVVKTQFGYHIILVEAKKPAGVRPYDEVRNIIRERLLSERADRVMTELNTLTLELQQQSHTKIYRDNIQ